MPVKARSGGVIADVAEGLTDNVWDIHIAVRGDLAHDHDHAGRGDALAGDAGGFVLCQDGIQYAVGNLVADLVGMSFSDGFGSKNSFLHVQSYLSFFFHCFMLS